MDLRSNRQKRRRSHGTQSDSTPPPRSLSELMEHAATMRGMLSLFLGRSQVLSDHVALLQEKLRVLIAGGTFLKPRAQEIGAHVEAVFVRGSLGTVLDRLEECGAAMNREWGSLETEVEQTDALVSEVDIFHTLPSFVVNHIFNFLPQRQIGPTSLACRRFCGIYRSYCLRRVVIKAKPFTPKAVTDLSLLRPRRLELMRSSFDLASVQQFTTLTEMTSLEIRGEALRDVHLPFIALLTNLQSLNLGAWDSSIPPDASGWLSLTALTGLRSLYIDPCAEPTLRLLIPHLSGLTSLQVDDPDLESEEPEDHVTNLGPLPRHLRALTLWCTDFSDAGMRQLSGLTALTKLVSWTYVSDASVRHLAGLTRLKTLELDHIELSVAGICHLSGLTALTLLNLEDCPLTDTAVRCLSGLTRLKKLQGRFKMSDVGLAALISGFPALTTLNLTQCPISDAGLAHLRRLTSLKKLWLDNTAITDSGLVHVKALTGLQMLSLEHCPITDAGLAHLSRLTSLKELRLDNTAITDSGLVHVKALTGLERLYLNHCFITDAGLALVKSLTGLHLLSLDYCPVTDAGLAHLSQLALLKTMDLMHCPITNAGLTHLSGLTQLEWLWVDGCEDVTDAGVAHLRARGVTVYRVL